MPTIINTNLVLLLPELFLLVWSFLLVAISFFVKSRNHQFSAIAALCGLLVSIILVLLSDYGDISGRVFINNSTALFFKLICAVSAAVTCLLMLTTTTPQISKRTSLMYPLLLASTGGMMLLAMAENLISVFVSLEMATLPLMTRCSGSSAVKVQTPVMVSRRRLGCMTFSSSTMTHNHGA